jgi:hypothetical protein
VQFDKVCCAVAIYTLVKEPIRRAFKCVFDACVSLALANVEFNVLVYKLNTLLLSIKFTPQLHKQLVQALI